ncbi:MAG TPA: serpin family protein [Patescibacteria group bacterium]|nr:serpin family protein [Patescibacteria group bacterium]
MAKAKPAAKPEYEHGRQFKPEVKNVIKLTLAFTKAVGNNQDEKSDNLVVSPYNAMAALSMVAKGADGLTRDEMAKTLFGVASADLEKAANDYVALNADVLAANKDQVTLTTANGVWTNQERLKLDPAYADDLKKTHSAEISAEDFGDKKTVAKINQWASDNTNGLIPEVLTELKKDDAAVLASALYFKGDWTHKFDKKLTEDKNFTADDAAVNATPTMKQRFREEGQVTHLQGADFEAVALTYGSDDWQNGKQPSMRVVLIRPSDDNVSARDWLAAQADGKVPQWLDPYAFNDAVGTVELPRLDIKQKFDLIPALKELGIKDAFNEQTADFGKMTQSGDLYIGKVQHDTVFKTNEEGSEAAAVTTVGMVFATSVRMPPPQIDVKFDRSFAFALQDVKTGAVIFVGAVNKPNDDMKPAVKAAKAKGPKLS